MAHNDLPKLIQDLLYAQEHRLTDDEVGRAAIGVIQAGVADEFVKGLIQNRVGRHRIAQAFAGPFRKAVLGNGDLITGLDVQGKPLRFPVQTLNGHCLTLGGSGSGKTTRSLFMALQIARLVPGVWLFDLRKREFAALRPYLARVGVDLIVVPARRLKLNPLQVPNGVEPADWAPRVADLLVQVLGLPQRASKLLHTTVVQLYKRLGIFGRSRKYPTLFHLREAVASDKSANPQARQAVLDSLDPVLLSIGCVFRYHVGWSGEDLSGRAIVFELGGISETEKDLILNSLILPEFTSRVARGISNPNLNLWICLDEAARLVSTSHPAGGISDLIGLIRGTGIGLDLSVQTGDVAQAILSNTATKVIGRCGSAADYDLVSSAMGLTGDQRLWMRHNLKPGLFVGQLGEGSWRHPFVFKVPTMTLQRTPVGFDCEVGCAGLDALRVIPADGFTDWDPDTAAVNEQPREHGKAGTNQSSLSDGELRYLSAVVSEPGLPSSRYPKRAGLSPSRAASVRERLVNLGYLRLHDVATGKRGRNAIVIEPLEPAIRAVNTTTGAES